MLTDKGDTPEMYILAISSGLFMQSNALERSVRRAPISFPLSMASLKFSIITTGKCWVPYSFQQPHWFGNSILQYSIRTQPNICDRAFFAKIVNAMINRPLTIAQKRRGYRHLTHSFPMHPFSAPWKHQKTVRSSDVSRGYRKGILGTKALIDH